jgi:dephospho-CoA kinase
VSVLLAARGAAIIDADAITKELQAPGAPLLVQLAEAFGNDILGADGALNRQVLADRVFGDADQLAVLNKIVHPAVGLEMNRRVDAELGGGRVVVLDVPLLAENPRQGLAAVLVVDCPVEVAVERLITQRGLREDDARARIARQASREQRLAIATRVLDNSGTRESLEAQVDTTWRWINTLPPTTAHDLERYRTRPAS